MEGGSRLGEGGIKGRERERERERSGPPPAKFTKFTRAALIAVAWCLLCVVGFSGSWMFQKVDLDITPPPLPPA